MAEKVGMHARGETGTHASQIVDWHTYHRPNRTIGNAVVFGYVQDPFDYK